VKEPVFVGAIVELCDKGVKEGASVSNILGGFR